MSMLCMTTSAHPGSILRRMKSNPAGCHSSMQIGIRYGKTWSKYTLAIHRSSDFRCATAPISEICNALVGNPFTGTTSLKSFRFLAMRSEVTQRPPHLRSIWPVHR